MRYRVCLVLLYTFWLLLHWVLLYSHNILPPKSLLPNLYFKFACLSNIINALLPFKYPMKLDTLIFGGMLTSKCTWSGIMWPSIISTPLYLHNVFIISCILSRYWLYIIFRLYFGVNTIWYLHIHFVCDKLLYWFAILKITFLFLYFGSLNNSIIRERWFFWYNLCRAPA